MLPLLNAFYNAFRFFKYKQYNIYCKLSHNQLANPLFPEISPFFTMWTCTIICIFYCILHFGLKITNNGKNSPIPESKKMNVLKVVIRKKIIETNNRGY